VFVPAAGRPTQQAFPYYNIAGDDEGLIYVLSWCGKWQSGILREQDNRLLLKGGQAVTHCKLLPVRKSDLLWRWCCLCRGLDAGPEPVAAFYGS